jgi:hypothetical protein
VSRKKKAPVVIIRKHKRIKPWRHIAAFALTGGTSSVVTAARAVQVSSYNARTRKLMEQGDDELEPQARGDGDDEFTAADHERARRAGEAAMRKLGGL